MQACLTLLKRNLVQPFSLTLLNVGATNFCATAVRGQGMPKAFNRLLGRPAATPSNEPMGTGEAAGKLLVISEEPGVISVCVVEDMLRCRSR